MFHDLSEADYDAIFDDALLTNQDKPSCEDQNEPIPDDLTIRLCTYALDQQTPPIAYFGSDTATPSLLRSMLLAFELTYADKNLQFDTVQIDTSNNADPDYFGDLLDALLDGHCDAVLYDHFVTASRTAILAENHAEWLCPIGSFRDAFHCNGDTDYANLQEIVDDGRTFCLVPKSTLWFDVKDAMEDSDEATHIIEKPSFGEAQSAWIVDGECDCYGADQTALEYLKASNCAPVPAPERSELATRAYDACNSDIVLHGDSFHVAGFALQDGHHEHSSADRVKSILF